MKTVLKELILNKKILILGFGREGRSTLREIMSLGGFSSISVADKNNVSDIVPNDIPVIFGDTYLDIIDEYDVVFKSPGIVLKRPADEYKSLIVGEMDVFVKAYGDRIIGVTGTKGKSTTSSLIAHILKENGKNVLFAGNIGIPVFDIADKVTKDSVIVIEMSCHQLEYIRYSPHVAVLLNIYEDHLDHYGTREKYALAKKHIYLNQGKDDLLFTTKETLSECENILSKTILIDKSMAPFTDLKEAGSVLKGEHNILNAAFAYEVSKMYGIGENGFLKAFSTFKGLPHRLEYIGSKDGVDYYDDSISTTVKSAISAIESIENAGIILLGGMERNLDYDELIDYLITSKLNGIVFMYDSGKRMYDLYIKAIAGKAKAPKAVYEKDLKDAVSYAVLNAEKGTAVLLSPAAASYDHFKNFEERGDVYKKLVF